MCKEVKENIREGERFQWEVPKEPEEKEIRLKLEENN